MKKVSIKINEKIHEKTEPTIKDWMDQQTLLAATEGKNIITDKDASQAVINSVASFLNLKPDDILKEDISLNELTSAYQTIQENILSCFYKPKEKADGDGEKK